MADQAPQDAITLDTRGKIAIITLNQPKKLNSMGMDLYYRLAIMLNEIAQRNDILITVLTGKGRFFSAGADVSLTRSLPPNTDVRRHWLSTFVANNLHLTRAFYTHPKLLITALNGPAVGLSAALIAFSDFIYAAPHAYLLTPFSSLGLVAEGASSRAFVQRLGVAKANEALLMSKKITAKELLETGFVNEVIEGAKEGESETFLEKVLQIVQDRLGAHLNDESLLGIKRLVRAPEREFLDRANVNEVFEGLERFARGVPQEEFERLRRGEKRHKL